MTIPFNKFFTHEFGNGGSFTGSKGTTGPAPAVPFNENGGFLASTFFLMLPIQDMTNGAVGVAVFNVLSFDDQTDGSSYSYRIEDIIPGRQPTIRRVILIYRDLGPATLTVTLSGTNDNRQAVSKSVNVAIGNVSPTGDQMTILVDVTLTAFQPQLTISRAAAGGPISIISATIIGEVEEVTL